jgi:hypothetical protein
MLEEIADSLGPTTVDREAGWFTVGDMHKLRPDLNRKQVRDSLDNDVAAGKYEKSKAYDQGHIVNCYKKCQ